MNDGQEQLDNFSISLMKAIIDGIEDSNGNGFTQYISFDIRGKTIAGELTIKIISSKEELN